MTGYTMRPLGRKRYRLVERQPDLFAWADEHVASAHLPETFAERALMKRLRKPLHLVRVYAENACLGGCA